jgi:hypothetical protein
MLKWASKCHKPIWRAAEKTALAVLPSWRPILALAMRPLPDFDSKFRARSKFHARTDICTLFIATHFCRIAIHWYQGLLESHLTSHGASCRLQVGGAAENNGPSLAAPGPLPRGGPFPSALSRQKC